MTNPIKAQIEAKHYWIQKGTPDLIADDLRELEPYLTDRPAPIIHVVEHFPIVALLAQKDEIISSLNSSINEHVDRRQEANGKIHELEKQVKHLEFEVSHTIKNRDTAIEYNHQLGENARIQIDNQAAELDKLRLENAGLSKCLAEVKSCKIGSVVIYNPNGEDKDAAFVVSLVQSVNAENEKLRSQLAQSEKDELEMIDERDAWEDRVNQIADALGDETDWSNMNCRFENSLELIKNLQSDLSEAKRGLQEAAEELYITSRATRFGDRIQSANADACATAYTKSAAVLSKLNQSDRSE